MCNDLYSALPNYATALVAEGLKGEEGFFEANRVYENRENGGRHAWLECR